MMTLHREQGWKKRLASEMDQLRNKPFRWGSNDCAAGLAHGVVRAITGVSLMSRKMASYRDLDGARKMLAELGHSSLREALAERLPEVHPAMARPGDLGLVLTEGGIGEAIGVFDYSGLVVLTADGHAFAPIDQVVTAFKVGE